MRLLFRPRRLVVVLLGVLFVGVFAQSSYGITWCFDYVFWAVNDRKVDANGNSAGSLQRELAKRGYKHVLDVRAKTGPGNAVNPLPQDIEVDISRVGSSEVETQLKKGDVLIFGESHAGIVRDKSGRFDHFLQIPSLTKQGKAYTPAQAATLDNWFVGRKSWTLGQLFALSRKTGLVTYAGWTQWLGRLVFGEKAGQQYPFLRLTAQVWRRTNKPTSVTLEGPGFSCTKSLPNTGVSGDGLSCRGTVKLPSKEEVVQVANGTQVELTVRANPGIPEGWSLKLSETGHVICEVPRRHPSATNSCTGSAATTFSPEFRKDRFWAFDLQLLEYDGLTGPFVGIFASLHEVQIWWGCPFHGLIPQCP